MLSGEADLGAVICIAALLVIATTFRLQKRSSREAKRSDFSAKPS
jgi:hypothetical protein